MNTSMEHYLDDLLAVLHFTTTDFQDPGCHFVGTAGLGCCIPPCVLVMIATGWERTLIYWYG